MHIPVFLDKVVGLLDVKPAGFYVDATFGCGGYSDVVLGKLNSNGRMLVIDKDYISIKIAKRKFFRDKRVMIYHGSYIDIKKILFKSGISSIFDGVIIDLGISSLQLEDYTRGFSFTNNGILDMRIDLKQELSAHKWLNYSDIGDIEDVLFAFGEKRFAKSISRCIYLYRCKHYIKYTDELIYILCSLCSNTEYRNQLIVKTFYAIRMFINNELNDLYNFLDDIIDLLSINGKLVILSFNFAEERVIKSFLYNYNIKTCTSRCINLRDKSKYICYYFKPTINDIDINISFRSSIIRVVTRLF